MEYKVGMKVRCMNNLLLYDIKGLVGKIVYVDDDDELYPYGIEFEKKY